VWSAMQDDQGRTYYYNTQTGVSQWEKPEGMP
jgi:far upstream element-binding protein